MATTILIYSTALVACFILIHHSSMVRLWRYYQNMVADTLDSTNGISELKVRAFTAHDAQKINDFLLAKSQDIVNQLYERDSL
ncbi:hypothetical protein [Acidithiobacillus sulfurivorans]|uniref:hypothetical protein n=1 Tax=Acidithiobacillus sulfurivorans TaxID=1958756 RepID=UPI001C06E124|nr:hypothetical protein [Acidithiobacillus sulfurivorans]